MHRTLLVRGAALAIGVTLCTGSVLAQTAPVITDVQRDICPQRSTRIGLNLASGSRLFGVITECSADHLRLQDGPKMFKVHFDEITALLSSDDGSTIAVVHQTPKASGWGRLPYPAKFVIVSGVVVVIVWLLAHASPST